MKNNQASRRSTLSRSDNDRSATNIKATDVNLNKIFEN